MVSVLTNGKHDIEVTFDERTPAGRPALVSIKDNRGNEGFYWVELIPADFGIGMAFRKLGTFGDEEASEYSVNLPCEQEESPTCECRGYLRFGYCRHITAAEKLYQAGALKPSPRPEHAEEIPAPAKREPWCSHCNDKPEVYCSHCTI